MQDINVGLNVYIIVADFLKEQIADCHLNFWVMGFKLVNEKRKSKLKVSKHSKSKGINKVCIK